MMLEMLKYILPFAGIALGWLGTKYDWLRLRPKEAADVKKVESDIRIDEANIQSKRIEDEIKVSQQALEWTAQFAAQLEKANKVIDKLQEEVERMRALNEKLRIDFGKQIDELEQSLDEERRHCKEIREELDRIKKQYGI